MRILGIIIFVILWETPLFSQAPKDFALEARSLKKAILEQHVQPRKIDDSYSTWVYDHVIEELDPEGLFFTQADLKTISIYRDNIDDELNGSTWAFLPHLTLLYKKCLERYQAGIAEIAQQPLDFFREEYFKDDTLWSADIESLRKLWGQSFRYNTMERLLILQKRSPAKSEKEFLIANEKLTRQRVQKVMARAAERILHHANGFESHIASQFFKSMAAAFDPHTTYFSQQEVQNFMSSLSTEGFYFGITLQENDRGEITIAQLMPGGPAWKSGEIHTGDVLQTLRWEGQEPLELWGSDVKEVNDVLSESNHSLLEVTLRKTNGTINTVKLKKEKLETEENAVKSFVLQGQHAIGYISLPDFYTDWGVEDGSKCANDVAKEIIKLKKENIEGLILDLRFNGGGSMLEAVAMAGIFIDAGPVGVIKNKAGELRTVKDMNRGTVYDGPLVLLVNGLSASASEFLAAALQDHHRAVIIGGQTYGKATAQQLLSIDPKVTAGGRSLNSMAKAGNFSFASITTEKMYRITGKTAQQTGVTPDIILPDVLEALPIHEENLPLAFPPDSIQKKMYYQPLPALPMKELSQKSNERVINHPSFVALKNYGEKLVKLQTEEGEVSLKWQDFKKLYAESESMSKELEISSNPNAPFKASTLHAEEQRMQMDSYASEFNRTWIKNLQEDIFVNEAFLIICDFIPYVNKK